MIKPIQLSKMEFAVKKAVQKGTPLNFKILNGSIDSFKTTVKLENDIAQLKLKLQEHKQIYNTLRRALNYSFGDDWVFCYNDLNDAQSDMYIECIAQKSMANLCEKKIAQLAERLRN